MTCSLLNLGDCLPESLLNFFLSLINAPLQYLLDMIQTLMTSPVDISTLAYLWGVIVYILSMFYGLFMVYAGFNLMISGYNAAKREAAKTWLRNIIIMIVMIQASYFCYELLLQINSELTASVFSFIDPNFFLLTLDNFANVSLEIMHIGTYFVVLFITLIVLVIRYVIVAFGVVFFPIAIFFYFIPPLQHIGKAMITFFGTFIFMSFFQALILLASSMIVVDPIFANFKILVMIVAFLAIDIFVLFPILVALLSGISAIIRASGIFSIIGIMAIFSRIFRFGRKLK